MPRRTGGLTSTEVNEVIWAVLGAADQEELYRLVSTMPALSNPIVHAKLRTGYQTVSFGTDAERDDFRGRYKDLFRILHERSYFEVVGADPETLTTEPPAAPDTWIGPRLLVDIAEVLDGRVPDDAGTTVALDDYDGVRAEVAALVGRSVDLEEYTQPAGTRWHVVLVACPRCKVRYLAARAWVVDLVIAPELLPIVQSGRLNRTRCPNCASIPCMPIRLWLGDTTGPHDLLACLTTVVRGTPSVYVYTPPPATPRTTTAERMLEIRAAELIAIAGLDEPSAVPRPAAEPDGEHFFTAIVVAYSADEVGAAVTHFTAEAARSDSDVVKLVRMLAEGLREGLAFADAEARAEELTANLASTAPVALDDVLRRTDPVAYLANVLVARAMVRRNGTPEQRVLMTRMLSAAYLGVLEPALGERALIEAEGALAALADPPDSLRSVVTEGRIDLLRSVGRHREAEIMRATWAEALSPTGASIDERHLALGVESDRWGTVQDRDLASAIRAFPEREARWRTLLADVDIADGQKRFAVQASYSGDLANHAAAITSAAHWVHALELVSPDGEQRSEADAHILLSLPIDRTASDDVVPELLKVVPEVLQLELSSIALYRLARAKLESAIELAQASEHWEFVTIQAHRLMNLCTRLDDPDEAFRFGELAIDSGSRIGAHGQVRTAALTLARQRLAVGAAEDAVGYFDRAALEAMRELIGLGHGESHRQSDDIEAVALLLLLSDAADPARIVASLESVRGARTANAALVGLPQSELTPLASARRRLQQLRLNLGPTPTAEGLAAVSKAETEVDSFERTASMRSPTFSRWVDATQLSLATADDLRSIIARSGRDTVWVSVIEQAGMVCSVAVSHDGVSSPTFFRGSLVGDHWTASDRTEVGAGLIEPHSEFVGRMSRGDVLIVSLPEGLRGLPVGGLAFDRRPLCASVATVCVTGLSLFEVAAERELAPTRHVLALAPDRDDRPGLAGARVEVEAIGAVMTGADRTATVLTGHEANIAALVSHAANADVVHVSCHGEIDPATGELSLLLAPDPDANDSGWLTEGRVLVELRLRPGAVVNLAGCRTGDVTGTRGPVLGGIVPAMLVSGAHSVIASLWPIDDQSTAALQACFYSNLLSGMRPAQALAAAQAAAWSGRLGSELMDAQHWAAFVVYGAT